MYLYNSLSHKKELFVPNNPDLVKMYTCGPTVYHFAHIGNLRTYTMEDVLEKYLRYIGNDVTRVMNITDVGHLSSDADTGEDKMLKGAKREKYILAVQEELFEVFEGQMRKLTVSQGALIMKLVDREVGKSSYDIIKGYKNVVTAGFWQGIAKIFGSDLKKPYDPEGEDALTEELVKIWEAGDFQAFYFAIFWKDPPVLPIPEKYL